jgi:hypothetical protein
MWQKVVDFGTKVVTLAQLCGELTVAELKPAATGLDGDDEA